DLAEEPLLRRGPGARADEHERARDIWVAVEQEGQRHLADEAGGADDEDAAIRERGGDVERHCCTACSRRRGAPGRSAAPRSRVASFRASARRLMLPPSRAWRATAAPSPRRRRTRWRRRGTAPPRS